MPPPLRLDVREGFLIDKPLVVLRRGVVELEFLVGVDVSERFCVCGTGREVGFDLFDSAGLTGLSKVFSVAGELKTGEEEGTNSVVRDISASFTSCSGALLPRDVVSV